MRLKFFLFLVISLQIAGCNNVQSQPPARSFAIPPPNQPPPGPDLGHDLLGSWFWNNDSQAFYANGRGDYFRAGTVCFSFSYTLSGNMLHKVADKPGNCGGVEGSYSLALSSDAMTMTHATSGYVSIWKRAPTPVVASDIPAAAPAPPAIPVPVGASSRSIQLRTVANRLAPTSSIGANQSGPGCAARTLIQANSLPTTANSIFYRAFFDHLKENGYKVLNDPNNMFQDKIVLRPDILIGVAVTAMKENICYPDGGLAMNQATMAHTAEVSLELEWQIFDALTSQMVTTLSTHGSARTLNAVAGGSNKAIEEAFTTNLNQLLSNPAFHKLVTSPSTGTAPAVNQITANNPFAALAQTLGASGANQAKAATDFDHANPPAPLPLSVGQTTHSLQLTKVINRQQFTSPVGASESGSDCAPKTILPPTFQMAMPTSSWMRVFFQKMKSSGYEVLSDPDDIFEDKTQLRPDFFVGAIITAEKRNVCYPDGVINAQSPQTAEVSLDIDWQVYDTLSKSLAVTVKTHSYVHRAVAETGGAEKALDEAFSNNLNGLLSDATFRRVMLRDGESVFQESAAQEHVIRLIQSPQFTGPITGNIRGVQNAVVTVLVGGGHGSGFMIGRDGLILTDRHVVGGARQVKVKLANGREMTASVLAADARHDVAVLKLQGGAGEGGLPVAISPVAVGADVYAIGAPLSTNLANTLTKGVVSGYRVFDGVTHIQSDVSIQPGDSGGPLLDESGNVVGLTRAQMRLGTASTGVNFFIPISVALQAVNVALDEGVR